MIDILKAKSFLFPPVGLIPRLLRRNIKDYFLSMPRGLPCRPGRLAPR